MAVEATVDEVAVRVLAPNASHVTLDGTNTYVLGRQGSGAALVVDPGPDDEGHRRRVEGVLGRLDAECAYVVVTHHHVDHAAGAQAWAAHFGARLVATTPAVAGDRGRLVGPGEVLEAGGLRVEAVPTPGHCSDHVAYRLPTGAVLTGDHVLGRGTSVVTHPEGDVAAYLESLRRVLDLGPAALLPGHGPELTDDPGPVLEYYLAHRLFREAQILAVLAEGPAAPAALVERIYADVDRRLWRLAAMSTRAGLAKLEREGRVTADSDSSSGGGGDGTFRLA